MSSTAASFENVQNTDFNAADTFSHVVTEDKLNDFGIYMGGPVILPKLYNGTKQDLLLWKLRRLRVAEVVDLCQQRSHSGYAKWRSVRLSRSQPGRLRPTC